MRVVSAASVVAAVQSPIVRALLTLVALPAPAGSLTALAIPTTVVSIIDDSVVVIGDDRVLSVMACLCLVDSRSWSCRRQLVL